MVKKLAVITSILLLLICGVSYGADGSRVSIVFDGAVQDENAFITNDTVYLPLRSVCEKNGYTVKWLEEKDRLLVTAEKDNEKVLINLTGNMITADGRTSSTIINRGEGVITKDNRVYLAEDLLSEYFALNARYDKQKNQVVLEPINENPIIIKNMRIISDSDELKITIQFPQIFGLRDKSVQDGINAVLRAAAQGAENEGLINAYELEKIRQEGYMGSPNKCETYFEYKLTYNQNGLLGIVLLNYQYAGGAHGTTLQSSHIFDLNTGKQLKLGDLMRSGSDYVSYINSVVREEIDQRIGAGILNEIEGSAFETISRDQGFYLSNNGLYIYFQQYEHFPYAAGIQEFPIAYSDLSSMIRQEYSFLK